MLASSALFDTCFAHCFDHVRVHRAVDPESEGRLASTDYNLEVTRLREYLEDRGKGQTGFRQPLVLEVIR